MNLITNDNTPWGCLKDPHANLVYWIHSKCACSFYKQIFAILDWKIIRLDEVNWDRDTVFSYIRDPLVKHRTGIIQWFYHNNKEELLKTNKNNNDFFEMLSTIAWLDWHSMPISDHLSLDKIKKITWIPIDVPEINHVEQTLELLNKHISIPTSIREQISRISPVNVSTGFKNRCKQKLLAIKPTPMIIKSIEIDRWIYDRSVIKNFEPDTYHKYIEKLKLSGLSQLLAEKIADRDVESGEYLNWGIE